MALRGHVKNGQIALDEPNSLPEGAAVSVQLLESADANQTVYHSRRQILQMPVEGRRQLLAEQSDNLIQSYLPDDDRTLWQGGDILE